MRQEPVKDPADRVDSDPRLVWEGFAWPAGKRLFFGNFALKSEQIEFAHLIFDMPGRSTNVFSKGAILELERFVTWLRAAADIRGAVIRSGKSVFSAGGDLTELATAYDAIVTAPREERSRLAFDTFFPLSSALRALESCGKPVAAAVAGLALGGGYELALACHRRVLADSGTVELGLPESLVGLLPGGGGTQRLPRLIGIDAAMPVLLYGKRLSSQEALAYGGADEIVPAGEEIAAAERWVLSEPEPKQPWDRPDWREPGEVHAKVEDERRRVLGKTFGLYPAPLAILDCVGRGLGAPFDDAIVIEMKIFAELIQRIETRNMIQTLFIGKLDLERRRRASQLAPRFDDIARTAAAALATEIAEAKQAGRPSGEIDEALAAAGYSDKVRRISGWPDWVLAFRFGLFWLWPGERQSLARAAGGRAAAPTHAAFRHRAREGARLAVRSAR